MENNITFGHIKQSVMRNNQLSIEAKAIYSYLASFADKDTGECFPSLDTILSELNISKNRFYKYIKELEDAGIIERQQRKNTSTLYRIINHVIVKSQEITEESTIPQIEAGSILQIEAHNNNTTHNNNTNITKDTKDTESDQKNYTSSFNGLISKEVKKLIAFYAPTINKAIDIEKTIFGAKKSATRELVEEGILNLSDLNEKGAYCIDFSEYGLNLKQVLNNIFMCLRRNRDNHKIKNHKAYFFGSIKKVMKEYMTEDKHIKTKPVPLFSPEELGVV